MPILQLDSGLDLFYQTDDNTDPWAPSETVVLVHGLAESGDAWRAWVPHFSRRYQVLRIDQRGFGRSTPMDASFAWSIGQLSDDLAAFASALALKPFHLVGAKLGGIVALQFAARYPHLLRSLSVIGAPASTRNAVAPQVPQWMRLLETGGTLGWARATMGDRLGTDMPAAAKEWWATMMARTTRSTLDGILRAVPGFDVESELPAIRCPTLVLTSTGSSLGSVSDTKAWLARIPRSELIVFDTDSYHLAASHPDACARAVLAFMERTAGQSAEQGRT